MSVAPLAGVTVLDLSSDVAGQFCGRLFADNGAEVILVEPPEGTATRRVGPFAPDDAGGIVSCLYWHLNSGKRSVLVEDADALAAEADVVIGSTSEHLARAPADAVICDITPFGRVGVLAHWRGSELIYQALSGTMFENGSPGREPLYGVGHRASYAAGVVAYIQCVAALRCRPSERHVVDVSIAEVAASMSFCRVTQHAYNGTVEGRDARTIPRAIARCRDGWAAVFIYDHRWRQSCQALGLDDLIDDPRFVDESRRLAHWDAFIAALEERLGSRLVDDVIAAGQAAKVVVAKSILPSELRDDPQLVARGFWSRASHPGAPPRLGPMFGFSATPQADYGPAPLIAGADGSTRPGRHAPQAPGSSSRTGARPLDGISVLDLTTAWSGPMATRILASLGATIIKIEGPGRIDDWRGPIGGGLPSRYPDLDPGERPYDRCCQFNTQNHDKLGVAIDLKSDAGRELALELARGCDVMIANFSAGTLDRMGLGFEVVSEVNPRLVVVEMPAYGKGGPMERFVALGPSMELMSGMGALIGYGDGRPTTTGPAYLDPIGGFNAAAAILTALAARDRTSRGQHVELAQREAAMHWIGEEIVYSIATGHDRLPRGNAHEGFALHDAFPCAGDDEWIAVAAEGESELAALAAVLGLEAGDTDPAHVAVVTRSQRKHELAARLQASGVRAAPVCNARDLEQSEFLMQRGLVQTMTHPSAGTHRYQGVALHLSGSDLAMRIAAPRFGEHTAVVLRERLGLDDSAIEALRAADVISERPRGAARTFAR